MPRAPLPDVRDYLHQSNLKDYFKRCYSLFIARMSSCDKSSPSCRLRSSRFGRSSQVVTSPCCETIFPDVILRIFPWMTGSISRWFAGDICPFTHPLATSAFPEECNQVGIHNTPLSDFRAVKDFAIVIIPSFSPPSLLATQIAPTACYVTKGSYGFYIRAKCTSLPSCTSDMLTVRSGQLTVRRLSPR